MLLAKTLIDTAIEKCGSAAALARAMGIDRAEITKLQKGTRPLSPELAAEIADIAGADARQAAIDAIILRAQGTRKEQVLREVLGKAVAAGEAAISAISSKGASVVGSARQNQTLNNGSDITNRPNGVYIVSSRIWSAVTRVTKRWAMLERPPTWGYAPHTPAPQAGPLAF